VINKPSVGERENKLHAAVSHALHDGRRIGEVSRAGSIVYSFSLIGFLMGLIAISIPLEYKLILGAMGVGVLFHLRPWNAERDARLGRRR